jgi:hypothetical protein
LAEQRTAMAVSESATSGHTLLLDGASLHDDTMAGR